MNPSAELPLRGLHAALAPSWWPPAPGWWFVLVVLLVLFLLLLRWTLRAVRRRRLRRDLLAELKGLEAAYAANRDAQRAIVGLSAFVRRLIIHVGGYRERAGSIGSDWTAFLSETVGADPKADAAARLLASEPYRNSEEQIGLQDVFRLANLWVKHCVARRGRSV